MDTKPEYPSAQPVTFAGVAAFGHASFARLLCFQMIVGAIAGGALVFLFEIAWVPVIARTIAELPPTGAIRNGTLDWPQPTPVQSAGSTFLWISIDPMDALDPGEGADLQVQFKRSGLRFKSLLGYLSFPYPPGVVIALNRTEVEPWWGAWRLPIDIGVVAGTILTLWMIWAALALAYSWPVRLISFYADRQLSWFGAWRLAAACLLPGALFISLGIVAYAWHRINLVQLLGAFVLHLMVGWIYVLCTPFCLPRVPERSGRSKGNPFSSSKKKRSSNPFAGSPRAKRK